MLSAELVLSSFKVQNRRVDRIERGKNHCTVGSHLRRLGTSTSFFRLLRKHSRRDGLRARRGSQRHRNRPKERRDGRILPHRKQTLIQYQTKIKLQGISTPCGMPFVDTFVKCSVGDSSCPVSQSDNCKLLPWWQQNWVSWGSGSPWTIEHV